MWVGVAGANGFIGCAAVRAVLGAGHHVLTFDRHDAVPRRLGGCSPGGVA